MSTPDLTEEAELLGKQIYSAIQSFSNHSPRSQQSSRFEIGVSDLGTCSERTRRMLAEIPEPETDALAAFIGTAVGSHAEDAIKAMYPEAITQATVSTTLHGDGGDYIVTGHPDVLLPTLCVDFKTSDGLEVAKRDGSNRQQMFQRMIYAKAAHEAGFFSVPLHEVRTANVWIDRSGRTKEVHVQMDLYSPEVVAEATDWLDEVVYAHLHGQTARKEPAREWCRAACGFFAECRMYDSDVEGLLTDPTVITAIGMYSEGHSLEVAGKKLKAEAKPYLEGISGYTHDFQLRWSHVNATEVPPFVRQAYDRISLVPVKKS